MNRLLIRMHLRKYIVIVVPIFALVIVGWVFNSFNSVSSSSEQEKIFQVANQSYQDQDYEKAITQYQTLLNEGAQGANIHNNLASAYQQTEDIGRSIVHYEKAIQLDHYDADIRTNLDRVRKDNTHEAEPLSFWQKITQVLSVKHWAVLASLVCLSVALLLVLQLIKRVHLPVRFQLTLVLIAMSFIVLSVFSIRSQQNRIENKAVVLNADTSLRISPFEGADELIVLRPGEVVIVDSKQEHRDYIQVKLASGRSGWLKVKEIEMIDVRKTSNKS